MFATRLLPAGGLSVPSLEGYWNNTVANVQLRTVAASGTSMAVAGIGAGTEASKYFTLYYDASGSLQWARSLDLGSPNSSFNGVAVDGSGNVIVATSYYSYPTRRGVLAKYSSAGVLQWQKNLYDSSETTLLQNVHADASGNIYVVGFVGANILVHKYNASGTLLASKTISYNNQSENAYSITTDTSGNVYIAGKLDAIDSDPAMFLTKLNSSLATQWSTRFTTDTNGRIVDVVADNTNSRLYIAAVGQGSSYAIFGYVDMATGQSATLKRFSGGPTSTSSIALASDGVYVTSYVSSSQYLSKFSTDLSSALWHRQYASTSPYLTDSAVTSDGDPLFTVIDSNANGVIVKASPAGLGTGTYTDFTYSNVSLTYGAYSSAQETDVFTTTSSPVTTYTATYTDTDETSNIVNGLTPFA